MLERLVNLYIEYSSVYGRWIICRAEPCFCLHSSYCNKPWTAISLLPCTGVVIVNGRIFCKYIFSSATTFSCWHSFVHFVYQMFISLISWLPKKRALTKCSLWLRSLKWLSSVTSLLYCKWVTSCCEICHAFPREKSRKLLDVTM
jgi:hypothetical protein